MINEKKKEEEEGKEKKGEERKEGRRGITQMSIGPEHMRSIPAQSAGICIRTGSKVVPSHPLNRKWAGTGTSGHRHPFTSA